MVDLVPVDLESAVYVSTFGRSSNFCFSFCQKVIKIINISENFIFLVELSCGMKTSDNVSYLVQSVSTSVGSPCTFTICPCNTNICRIRYDFNVSHFHLRGEASRSNQMLRSTWDTWLTAIDSIWMLLLLNKTHYSVPHHYRLQHLDHCTAAIKINRPDHNMHMS